jgi:hypothetical protein
MLEDGGYDVDQPLFGDPNAYVSDGMLVAHIDELLTTAGTKVAPGQLVHWTRTVLEGHLVHTPDGWQLEDLVSAGRVPFSDYWRMVARYPDPVHVSQPICKGQEGYDSAKRIVCSYLDIASADTSPSAACDALSVGAISSLCKPAKLGDVGRRAPAPLNCASNLNPDTDGCDGGVP